MLSGEEEELIIMAVSMWWLVCKGPDESIHDMINMNKVLILLQNVWKTAQTVSQE